MTAVEAIASNLEIDAERAHFEHEHMEDELQDLDDALKSIDFDSAPLPELGGLVEADAIVRNLERELPDHFLEEEASLLPDMARLDPELTDWVSAMRYNHDLIWRELEAIHTNLDRLRASTNLAEDLEEIEPKLAKLRELLRTHACAEETVANAVVRMQSLTVA